MSVGYRMILNFGIWFRKISLSRPLQKHYATYLLFAYLLHGHAK